MTATVVGIDVGGSKTALRAADAGSGILSVDVTVPTQSWRGEGFPEKARVLLGLVDQYVGSGVAALAVGAHGCDTQEQCDALQKAIAEMVPFPVRVVNDAHLLSYAAGYPKAIGVISGTGSIAVGTTPEGKGISAGGWGWLVGDDGGATGLVREAVRAALIAADCGHRDPILETALTAAAGVTRIGEVSMKLMLERPEQWALLAPAVFTASVAGSPVAKWVVNAAARSLGDLVDSVASRGAAADQIVLGGSVIASQPEFAADVRSLLATSQPEAITVVLDQPPVAGALVIAHTLHAAGKYGAGVAAAEPTSGR
ncbi:N-acetylglucosamine kinase [Arthrobacter sp. W4I7]|uniref:N-acetylglucosamine kinase n=1 Tax=Arthrobacter sp. W4I7 TaxID=3042296 RepID=UPI00278087F3|nr:BadF/BadG/BcrA/BcrD ATPase family protein [Arthrobacter sp. W4I7]MDQ0693151.1 glucosamine kinase [Arthrobacter sp. W4I7]